MSRLSPLARLTAAAFAWLAVFALIVTVGEAVGLEAVLPVGGLAGSDLAAGLAFGVVLLACLVASGRTERPAPRSVG